MLKVNRRFGSICCLRHADFLLGLIFNPGGVDDMGSIIIITTGKAALP
jgi:hypothetical protein